MVENTETAELREATERREPAATAGCKYLYAIVPSDTRIAGEATGIDGAKIEIIAEGRVAAVVSDSPSRKIRPERRRLAAHQAALRRLMESVTPLPSSFGIIADGPRSVRKMLARNQRALLDQLHRVCGKVEMGLRVTWDVPNIFEYFVNTHPQLHAARDRLLGVNHEPSHEDKIEVGRMFDHLLNDDREVYFERVESVLAPVCAELKANKCRDEREVLNLACLVDRANQDRFEGAVFETAKIFDNNFAFDFNGPWAPHNFVELNIDL